MAEPKEEKLLRGPTIFLLGGPTFFYSFILFFLAVQRKRNFEGVQNFLGGCYLNHAAVYPQQE